MTREIKFRGKRLDNGEWLYGSLLVSHFKDDKKERYFITQFSGNYTFEHEVDPATVGQFTGLKDKNGRDIWEGDIFKEDGSGIVRSVFRVPGGLAFEDNPVSFGYDHRAPVYPYSSIAEMQSVSWLFQCCEVIGNIHDNPELLKTEYTMKNFDLEAAKRGAAVCTRDGRNARIIAFDCKGCGRKPILALIDMGDWEQSASWTERGEIIEDFKDASDLMMRDDDYLEKLERGEYDHIADARKMVGPTIKQNLNTDREYWRRVYAGQTMQGIFAGRNWRSGEMIPDCIGYARNAVELADALIEELEKTETK